MLKLLGITIPYLLVFAIAFAVMKPVTPDEEVLLVFGIAGLFVLRRSLILRARAARQRREALNHPEYRTPASQDFSADGKSDED